MFESSYFIIVFARRCPHVRIQTNDTKHQQQRFGNTQFSVIDDIIDVNNSVCIFCYAILQSISLSFHINNNIFAFISIH